MTLIFQVLLQAQGIRSLVCVKYDHTSQELEICENSHHKMGGRTSQSFQTSFWMLTENKLKILHLLLIHSSPLAVSNVFSHFFITCLFRTQINTVRVLFWTIRYYSQGKKYEWKNVNEFKYANITSLSSCILPTLRKSWQHPALDYQEMKGL